MTRPVHAPPDVTDHLEGPISPELALVDVQLAARARALLPDPVPPPRVTAPVQDVVRLPSVPWIPDELLEPPPTFRRRSTRSLVAVAAVTMVALLLFDVRVQVGERRASAVPSAPAPAVEVGGDTPARGPVQAAGEPPAAPTERRFAWAPSPGASSYRVEFFRGDERVYAGTTRRAEITVPPRWVHDGVRRSFQPGEYRWYVWPVTAGRTGTRAIVQATVSVPSP